MTAALPKRIVPSEASAEIRTLADLGWKIENRYDLDVLIVTSPSGQRWQLLRRDIDEAGGIVTALSRAWKQRGALANQTKNPPPPDPQREFWMAQQRELVSRAQALQQTVQQVGGQLPYSNAFGAALGGMGMGPLPSPAAKPAPVKPKEPEPVAPWTGARKLDLD